MTLTADAVQRRFLILVGLRWLPVGFIAPLLVLILTRNLSLTNAGQLLAIYGITTSMLELPTGGLADGLGRKPVLLASSAASVVFFALLLVGDGFAILAGAIFVGGISRALDSGPLESWFVDRSKAIDPQIDLRVGLSRGGIVDGLVLAIGAIVGGILPTLFDGRLLVSVVVALAFQVVHLLAVLMLMHEIRPSQAGGVKAALVAVPDTVRGSLAFGRSDRHVRHLLLGALTIGVGLVSLEHLWQPRFVDLLDADKANTTFLGLLLATAFLGAAIGAWLAPRFARLIERWTDAAATVGQLAQATTLLALAAVTWLPGAAALFIATYTLNGFTSPLRAELIHENVSSDRRSTMLSADSLVLQAGGFTAALTLPALADARGIPLAWMISALVLALGALAYLKIPTGQATQD